MGSGTDDCDDTNPNINPSVMELCGDGIDNNCDGNSEPLTINTWIGPSVGNWYDDINYWSQQRFPILCDSIVIPNGYHISLDPCNDIEVKAVSNNQGQLTIKNGSTLKIKQK